MAQDKFGNEIHEGDYVEFVFGGEPFHAQVDGISEDHGIDHVEAEIGVRVPAGSVQLVEKAGKPTPSAKESDTPDSRPTTPRPAPRKEASKWQTRATAPKSLPLDPSRT
jgi:hypothetical protein